MKYKIVHVTPIGSFSYFEVLYKKNWFSPWKRLTAFYKSPFEEMPGWWNGCFNTFEEAKKVLDDHQAGLRTQVSETVYEKDC